MTSATTPIAAGGWCAIGSSPPMADAKIHRPIDKAKQGKTGSAKQ